MSLVFYHCVYPDPGICRDNSDHGYSRHKVGFKKKCFYTYPPPLGLFTVLRKPHPLERTIVTIEEFVGYRECWPITAGRSLSVFFLYLQCICLLLKLSESRKWIMKYVRNIINLSAQLYLYLPGVSFTVLISRVSDHLSGQWEEFIPPC